MELRRKNLEVTARFMREGGMLPVFVVGKDGKDHPVDCVFSVVRPPSGVSFLPIRYDCVIGGMHRTLFFDPKSEVWYLEIETD